MNRKILFQDWGLTDYTDAFEKQEHIFEELQHIFINLYMVLNK